MVEFFYIKGELFFLILWIPFLNGMTKNLNSYDPNLNSCVYIARQYEQMDTLEDDHVYSLPALPSGGEGPCLSQTRARAVMALKQSVVEVMTCQRVGLV